MPDMLSQLPLLTEGPTVQDALVACLVRQIRPQTMDLNDVKTQTSQDSLLLSVCHFIQSGWLHKSKIPQNLLPFYHVQDELEWSNGVLLRGGRLVLPKSLQAGVLQGAHVGHLGMVRMKWKLCDVYWWPRLDTQVETVVRSCPGCQMSGKSHPPDSIPPISVPKPVLP